jgi:hypothetical protein
MNGDSAERRSRLRKSRSSVAPHSFHRDECGQVTFLFVFASIALVVLLALVINTAKQTSRKIEMQGAADSAAIAGGVWMARGMNLMVLNNKGMADLLSVMIEVRSLRVTCNNMGRIAAGLAASVALIPGAQPVAEQLARESAFYFSLSRDLTPVDESLSEPDTGKGWQLMRLLDRLNQEIKSTLPYAAEGEAIRFARANGAETTTPRALLSGSTDSKPVFPVGRGGEGFIAREARDCGLPKLRWKTKWALEGLCTLSTQFPCMTPFMAWAILDVETTQNVNALGGNSSRPTTVRFTPQDLGSMRDQGGKTIQEMLDELNKQQEAQSQNGDYKKKTIADVFRSILFSAGTETLSWPDDPPLPMMLTDDPKPEGNAVIDDPTRPINLLRVSRELQFLALARAAKEDPLIGAKYFIQPGPEWLAYAQADVYNPEEWWMFSQNWRVKLARATLLNYKIGQLKGLPGNWNELGDFFDLSYVNTH